MIKFFKKRWYVILIIVLVVYFIFYKNSATSAVKNKANSYTIKRENLREVLTLSGEIDAEESIHRSQDHFRLALRGKRMGRRRGRGEHSVHRRSIYMRQCKSYRNDDG